MATRGNGGGNGHKDAIKIIFSKLFQLLNEKNVREGEVQRCLRCRNVAETLPKRCHVFQ
jgi:hypothetical protein